MNMKKFIKDLQLLLPCEQTFYTVIFGMGLMWVIFLLIMIATDSRIVNKYEYQKLQQHCTVADSLINSIDTNYTLDVISELPIYDEYVKTLDLP